MANYTYAELAGLWIEAHGPGQYAATAAAVAEAESSGDPTRIHNTAYPNRPNYHPPSAGNLPEYSVGLWQINIYVHTQYTQAEMLDPLRNAEAAVAISDDGTSFRPWTTYKDGTYKQYLRSNFTPIIPDLGPGQTTPTGALSSLPSGAATAAGMRGYSDLRNSVARHLPTQLTRSRKAGAATLRTLAHRHRVKG